MNRIYGSFWGITSIVALTCCSPCFQNINVRADDPKADIYVNNTYAGKGEVLVQLPCDQPATFRGEIGHRKTNVALDTTLSNQGIVCLYCWPFLFPLIGLASPHSWQLEQNTVPLHIPQEH